MNDKIIMNDNESKTGAETRPFEALVICTGQPRIELYNEDWRDILPRYEKNAFNLAIVDPPYGIGDCVSAKSSLNHSEMKWNNDTPKMEYFEELKRVSKNQIIWGVNYYSFDGLNGGRIIHNKVCGQKQSPSLSDSDIAYQSFNNLIKQFDYMWKGNIQGKNINWDNTGIDRRIHPTQKPVALYRWLLQNYAEEGDKILDTHLGSGSIAIACYEEGFDLVGTEIDEDYFEAMTKRFNEHKRQGKLF